MAIGHTPNNISHILHSPTMKFLNFSKSVALVSMLWSFSYATIKLEGLLSAVAVGSTYKVEDMRGDSMVVTSRSGLETMGGRPC